MRIDRTTKLLLALIAMGLFLNAIVPLTQPATVHAQDTAIRDPFGADFRSFEPDFQ